MRRPPRDLVWLLVSVVLFGAFYAAFARLGLRAFPFSGDEYSYLLQAELFAHGLLHAPTPPHPELLRVDHVIFQPWVCSKYPPGTSALLALGVRVGVPWIVVPVEGLVGLLAMGAAARKLLGGRPALLAVALLGASPLFAFQAASFFSHTAATMWLALALSAFVAWSIDGGSWRMVLAGAAIGCAFLTRPLDAVLFGAALLSLRSVKPVALTVAGTVPFLGLYLAYQDLQFGSPFADGYSAYEPTFRAIYGERTAAPALSLANAVDGEQMWHHLDILRSFAVEWTVPGTVLLALLGWAALRGDARVAPVRRFCVLLVVLLGGSLFVAVGGTDDGARPRYLSCALLPLALFGAVGWTVAGDLLRERLSRGAVRAVAVVVWILPVVQLSAFLVGRLPEIWVRQGLTEAVDRAGIHDGVVVIRALYPTRHARNGPFFDAPVLYASPPGSTSVDTVAEAFPGRPIYEAHEGRVWTVQRVR